MSRTFMMCLKKIEWYVRLLDVWCSNLVRVGRHRKTGPELLQNPSVKDSENGLHSLSVGPGETKRISYTSEWGMIRCISFSVGSRCSDLCSSFIYVFIYLFIYLFIWLYSSKVEDLLGTSSLKMLTEKYANIQCQSVKPITLFQALLSEWLVPSSCPALDSHNWWW